MTDYTLHVGDCLEGLRELPDGAARTCVTSPPYFGLRDYGLPPTDWPAMEYSPMPCLPAVSVPAMSCCLGLESSPADFIGHLVLVFREARRALTDDGTVWLNLGDSYAGSRSGPQGRFGEMRDRSLASQREMRAADGSHVARAGGHKNLLGIPWRVAFALQSDGWCLRQDIIWHKPNPMPESVRDRCTKSHEYLFLLSKSPRYYFDAEAIAEPATKAGQVVHSYNSGAKDRQDVSDVNDRRTRIGLSNWNKPVPDTRNKRSVWTVTTKPFKGAHFAVFPPDLIEPCILAGSAPGDQVIDPFTGSGTTGMVAGTHGRKFYGCELNPEYAEMANERIAAAYAQGRLFA